MAGKPGIKLGDVAKVKVGSSNIYEGRVTAVYIEGIFVYTINLGTKYVEWENVLDFIDAEEIKNNTTLSHLKGLIEL